MSEKNNTTYGPWSEYAFYVIKRFEEIEKEYKDFKKELSESRERCTRLRASDEKRLDYFDRQIVKLKVKSGIWGALGSAAVLAVTFGVYVIYQILKGSY